MSLRLLTLVLLTGLTTLTGSAADAASFPTNMNIRATGPGTSTQSGQTTMQIGGRPSGYGGYGNGAPPPGVPYGGPRPPRETTYNSNDQFDTSGNLNPGGGGSGFKPSKSPAHK